MKYRPEVDGLRAIAVLGVILFHAGMRGLSGGFLGVDIFFVISGYLITGVILEDLQKGSFSLTAFFERRIRRIIPALNVTMLLCIPLAAVFLLPDDLENFGQSLIATAAFGNNILLMQTSGYFDLGNSFKPLMHTWSLGVEEHYYLLIPLLMSAAFAAGRRRGVGLMTAAVGIASMAFCLWVSRRFPDANFYLVFSRAWELGAGGLTLIAEPHIRARFFRKDAVPGWLGGLGLAMIFASLFLLDMDMGLPGWPTIFPVAGTCLVLMCAGPRNFSGRLLSVAPLVFIGLLSYSAYLYHQPVFTFFRILQLSEPSPALMMLLLVPVFGLAYLSWRFVERPFRNRQKTSFTTTAIFGLATTGIIMAVGTAMVLTSGFLQWRPELATGDPQFGRRQNAIYNEGPLRFAYSPLPQQAATPRLLVIGNSFARDFINMGLETGRLKAGLFSYSPMSTCAFDAKAFAMAARADLVVVALSFSPAEFSCLDRGMARLAKASGAQVYLLGTKNFGWNNNAVMLLPSAQRYQLRLSPRADISLANRHAAQHFAGRYIDILGKISDGAGRIPVFTPERKFISQDTNHLTKAGAAYIGSMVFRDSALRALPAQADRPE